MSRLLVAVLVFAAFGAAPTALADPANLVPDCAGQVAEPGECQPQQVNSAAEPGLIPGAYPGANPNLPLGPTPRNSPVVSGLGVTPLNSPANLPLGPTPPTGSPSSG